MSFVEEAVDVIANVMLFLCEFEHQRIISLQRTSPFVSKEPSEMDRSIGQYLLPDFGFTSMFQFSFVSHENGRVSC